MADHRSLDLGFELVERDSAIGGGLLAGALAYRLFLLLLPTAVLLVSGLGLYAEAVEKSTSTVAAEAGTHGLIASEVASAASGRAGGAVFLLMTPAVLYSTVSLYRAIAKVYALAWYGSARGVRLTPRGIACFGGALLLQLVAVGIVGWIRRTDQLGGIAALLVYLFFIGGAWLVVSTQLPHRDVRWTAFVPGALGIAAALLFSLVLVGLLIVVSAELDAALDDRRSRD